MEPGQILPNYAAFTVVKGTVEVKRRIAMKMA